jgi:hypothetical protein
LSKEDHKKLLAATLDSSPQESAVVTGEGMSLKQVLRLVGGGNDLYEKLSEYGVGSGEVKRKRRETHTVFNKMKKTRIFSR